MQDLEVRAYFSLAERLGSCRKVTFTEGITVAGVAEAVGLEEHEVGLVLLNGCRAETHARLKPGDRVAYFPEYVPFHRVYGMCVL
jgi:hypothetical protein